MMGVSSDGILVYGIDLGEEKPAFLEEDMEFDDLLMEEGGQLQYGDDGHDFKNQWAFIAAQPVELTLYCSYDYPMYILSVRGTKADVSRGYVEEIASLDVDADKRSAFIAWCVAHGIESPEPKWLLASMYG